MSNPLLWGDFRRIALFDVDQFAHLGLEVNLVSFSTDYEVRPRFVCQDSNLRCSDFVYQCSVDRDSVASHYYFVGLVHKEPASRINYQGSIDPIRCQCSRCLMPLELRPSFVA